MNKKLLISCVLVVFSISESAQETCTTPDNAYGTCISLGECPTLAKLVSEEEKIGVDIKNYIRLSECRPKTAAEYFPYVNPSDIYVCCPSRFPQPPYTTFRPSSQQTSRPNSPRPTSRPHSKPSLIRDPPTKNPESNATIFSQIDLSTKLTTNLSQIDSAMNQQTNAPIYPTEMNPSVMNPYEMNSSEMKPSEMKPSEMKPSEMKPSRYPPTNVATEESTYHVVTPPEFTTNLPQNSSQYHPIYPTVNISSHRETNSSTNLSTNSQIDESTNLPIDITTHRPSHTTKQPETESSLTESDLPAPGECGTQPRYRSMEGEITQFDEYPWTALIQYKKDEGQKRFSCGATLISNRYVLTAAHCLSSRNLGLTGWKPFSIRLGENNLQSPHDCDDDICADDVLDIPIEKYILHKDYDLESNGRFDDIALIRLSRPVNFTQFVRPICLPFAPHVKNITFDESALLATEFGKAKNGKPGKLKLRRHFTQTDFNKCKEQYQQETSVGLTNKQFCASIRPDYDSCGSSSGVGMMSEDRTKSSRPIYLVAISSFGPYYCSAGFPGVFTRVDQYLDWTLENMRK